MTTEEKKKQNKEVREILIIAVILIGIVIGGGLGLLKYHENSDIRKIEKRIEHAKDMQRDAASRWDSYGVAYWRDEQSRLEREKIDLEYEKWKNNR